LVRRLLRRRPRATRAQRARSGAVPPRRPNGRTTLNDENIVVLGDLEETEPDAEAAQRQLAAYALGEINRIITDLSEPV
jgi:hypothetical protein